MIFITSQVCRRRIQLKILTVWLCNLTKHLISTSLMIFTGILLISLMKWCKNCYISTKSLVPKQVQFNRWVFCSAFCPWKFFAQWNKRASTAPSFAKCMCDGTMVDILAVAVISLATAQSKGTAGKLQVGYINFATYSKNTSTVLMNTLSFRTMFWLKFFMAVALVAQISSEVVESRQQVRNSRRQGRLCKWQNQSSKSAKKYFHSNLIVSVFQIVR